MGVAGRDKLLAELTGLLGVNCLAEPKDYVRMRCYVEFEGHGRASESFEVHWELVLPTIPHHWKSTTGWRRGNVAAQLPMRFHGETAEQVTAEAVDFLRAIKYKPGMFVGPCDGKER